MQITHSRIDRGMAQLLLNKNDRLNAIFVSLLLQFRQHMGGPGMSEHVSINLYTNPVTEFPDDPINVFSSVGIR